MAVMKKSAHGQKTKNMINRDFEKMHKEITNICYEEKEEGEV